MEDTLRESVRGQDEALKSVSDAVRMQRAGLSGQNRPLASFFFLGPTGVGKTELCKKLANFIFSTESAVVRFDMSEFQEKHTISRLIGRYVTYGSHLYSAFMRSRTNFLPARLGTLDTMTLGNSPKRSGENPMPSCCSTSLRKPIGTSPHYSSKCSTKGS